MKKKHLIIAIIIVLAIVGIFITIKVTSDLNKETKIRNEIKEIKKVLTVTNIDSDNANEILDRRIIEKGPYAEVEDSIKSYYKDLYSNLKNLSFLLAPDSFNNYLTSKNLNEDKPIFLKSKEILRNSNAQMDDFYKKINNLIEEESIKLSYINAKETKSYYRTFYLELTELAVDDAFKEELKKAYDSGVSKIKVYTDIFDFLIVNKGHWVAESEMISFDDPVLYEEYENIIKRLVPEVVSKS